MQRNNVQLKSMLAAYSKTTVSYPWLMLISRSVLFIIFQALIMLALAVSGTATSWNEAARWWTFMAFLANFVSIYLLVRLFNAEGKRYFDIFAVLTRNMENRPALVHWL